MTAQHILLIPNPVSGKMKSRSGLFDILDELYHLPDGTPASRPPGHGLYDTVPGTRNRAGIGNRRGGL